MKLNEEMNEIYRKYSFILTRTQKRWGIVLFILTIIGAVCETLGVSVILPFVQVMMLPDQLMQNDMVRQVVIKFNIQRSHELIWIAGCSR